MVSKMRIVSSFLLFFIYFIGVKANFSLSSDSVKQINYIDEDGNKKVIYEDEVVYKTEKNLFLDVDPTNLFLVTLFTQGVPVTDGLVLQTSKQKSVEEILMYEVLKSYWMNKKWVRFVEGAQGVSPYQVGHPSLTTDGNRLFFIADMPGSLGGTDIYYADNINGKWSEPKNLGPAINTKFNETFPVIDANNRLRYISNGGLTYIKISQILGPVGTNNAIVSTNPVPLVKDPVIVNQPISNNPTPKESVNTNPVKPIVPSSNVNANNVFRITLGGFKTPDWSVLNEFKVYGELISETNDLGITLVRLGDFLDINEAKSVASEIRKKKWFENAGVYLYKNGKYIKQ